jgi:hypothetical protein
MIAFKPMQPAGYARYDEKELKGNVSIKLHRIENPGIKPAADDAYPPRMDIVSGGQPDGESIGQTCSDF